MASPKNELQARVLKEEALRRLSGYPKAEQDVGDEFGGTAETPFMAPDDLLGPAELKAAALGGKALATGGAKVLAGKGIAPVMGVLGSRAAKTTVGRLLELKPEQEIMEAARRIIAEEPDAVGMGGIGAAESAGKSLKSYIGSKLDEARNLGAKVYESPSALGKIAPEDAKILESAAGFYQPSTNRLVLNPKTGAPLEELANTAGHEVEHVKDALLHKANMDDMVNYADMTPDKAKGILQHLSDINFPISELSGKDADMYQKLLELAQSQAMTGEIKNPLKLVNLAKGGHFSKYKNYELENAMRPLAETMVEASPREFKFLKEFPSYKNLPILKKK